VSQVDIFPTICDVLGLAPPDGLQGTSLVPLVEGVKPTVRDEVFAEINFHVGYEPQRCVRTERWKYVRRYLDRRHGMQAHTDPSPSKAVMAGAGLFEQPYESHQLFDLLLDPYERVNLFGRPGHEDITADLVARLERWQAGTNDPLLLGPIAPPEGSVVHDADRWEPAWD